MLATILESYTGEKKNAKITQRESCSNCRDPKVGHKQVQSSTGDHDGGCNVLEPVKNTKQEKRKGRKAGGCSSQQKHELAFTHFVKNLYFLRTVR